MPYPVGGGTLLPSASRTADVDVDFDNTFGQGIIIVIDWTEETDSGASIVYTLQGRDPTSGKTWDLIAATITGVGTTVLQVSPNLATVVATADADGLPVLAVSNVAQKLVPPHLRLNVNAADTKAVIYSVAAYLTA